VLALYTNSKTRPSLHLWRKPNTGCGESSLSRDVDLQAQFPSAGNSIGMNLDDATKTFNAQL
jgi:hypothetical protein